jgi:hypothetical protein
LQGKGNAKKARILFVSSTAFSNITENSDQGAHDKTFDRCLPFQGELFLLKHIVNDILPLKHGILEVRIDFYC